MSRVSMHISSKENRLRNKKEELIMKNTEHKLKKLFDFQKFEKNQRLSKMINEAESEGVLLSDEELSFVNAAGEQSGPSEHQ